MVTAFKLKELDTLTMKLNQALTVNRTGERGKWCIYSKNYDTIICIGTFGECYAFLEGINFMLGGV